MNKSTIVLIGIIYLIIIPFKVYSQDGVFPYLPPEAYRNQVLTVHPVILPEAVSDRMLAARYRFGLSETQAVTLKSAAFGTEALLGADYRYTFLPGDGQVQMETQAGLQWFGNPGLKMAAIVAYKFEKVWAYTGLDYVAYYSNRQFDNVLLLPVGAGIPLLNNRLYFTFEAGVPVSAEAKPFQSVSFGLSYRLK
jgi:hypothetical protein